MQVSDYECADFQTLSPVTNNLPLISELSENWARNNDLEELKNVRIFVLA